MVKVYVSVFGDERGKEVALAGLKSKAKYVRGELGKRMKLRLTPEIRFIEDESLERGSRVRLVLLYFIDMIIYISITGERAIQLVPLALSFLLFPLKYLSCYIGGSCIN